MNWIFDKMDAIMFINGTDDLTMCGMLIVFGPAIIAAVIGVILRGIRHD